MACLYSFVTLLLQWRFTGLPNKGRRSWKNNDRNNFYSSYCRCWANVQYEVTNGIHSWWLSLTVYVVDDGKRCIVAADHTAYLMASVNLESLLLLLLSRQMLLPLLV